jgi:predicted dehydrogenase
MPMKSEVDWRGAVLFGAGRMAHCHALALKELGVPVTSVCDLNREACDALSEEFSVPSECRFTSSAEMMAANQNADIVVIATTANSHAELVIEAAKAGAQKIICEKPLATSVADCDAMIAACRASNTELAVNHQMRFMDKYINVRDEFASGKLGRLASMTVIGGCMGLAMNGSHYVEAFSFLTGAEPISARGWFIGEEFNNPRGPEFFDRAGDFQILGDTGQRLTIMIGADQGHGMTVTYAGTYGHIFVDELAGDGIVTTRKTEHRSQSVTRYGMPWDQRKLHFTEDDNIGSTRDVLRALATSNGYPDGVAGRRVLATLTSCYASAEHNGQLVKINDPTVAIDRRFPWA